MRQSLTAGVLLLTAVAVPLPRLHGQAAQTDQKPPAFEVASVKPNRSTDTRATTVPLQPNGRYTITNASIMLLITFAYQRPENEIVGAPDWARNERFDVDAKADGTPPPVVIFQMLRSLLVDRFKMATHNETRPMPVYLLIAAKSGQLGPQFRRHTDDNGCIDRSQLVPRGIQDPAKPLPTPVCGGWSGAPNLGRLAGQRIGLDNFAYALSGQLGRPVIERTGLIGPFDLTIEWTPQGRLPPEAQAILDASQNPDRPSIFTAVQEQLGLRLVPDTAPIDVLVIDHVERPTPD
jgi:uncharacterized protein (TIGR03435 family)